MVFVKKQPGDSTDSLIRKFSRKVQAEGVMLELKKREFHLKKKLAKKYKKELIRKMTRQFSAR